MNNSLRKTAEHRKSGQVGFSLVELMVAILITMIVTAGAVAVFGSLKFTFRSQDSLGQLQDSQRLALTMLTNTVQSAGHFVGPQSNTVASAFPATTTNNVDGTRFASEASVVGASGASATASDVLNVRFQSFAGDGLLNCLGQENGTGTTTWINTFEVDATSKQLTCRVNNSASATPLVDNVHSLKIKYLVKNGANSYAYKEASELASTEWTSVISVQVAIRFVNTLNPTSSTDAALPALFQTINLMSKT